MSALQDILDKMYVDPELLEHLEENQKLLLFIKMREEQVRRWRVNEERLAEEERANASRNRARRSPNRKRVQWKMGKDGDVWVWVMGEHPDDLTIEQILENEAKQKARQLAEREVLLESLKMNSSFLNDSTNLDEEKLKNQLMQIQLFDSKLARHSQYDELNDTGGDGYGAFPSYAFRQPTPVGGRSSIDDRSTVTKTISANSADSRSSGSFSPLVAVKPTVTPSPSNNCAYKEQSPITARNGNNFPSSLSADGDEDFVQFTRSYIPGTTSVKPSAAPVTASRVPEAQLNGDALPFPVGSSRFVHSAMSSPIASTTVFASSPVGTENAQIKPVNKPTKFGFGNIGGGRVIRLAARLSGGSKTSFPKSFSPEAAPQIPRTQPSNTKSSESPTGNSQAQNRNPTDFSRPASLSQNTSNTPNAAAQNSREKTTKADDHGDYYDNHILATRQRLSGVATGDDGVDGGSSSRLPQRSSLPSGEEDPINHLRSVLRERAPAKLHYEQQQDSLSTSNLSSDNLVKLRGGTGVRARILRAVDDQIEKRQSQILEQLLDQQEKLKREAEEDQQREWMAWEEQEKKAREAEAQIRLIAQRARQEHMKMRTSSSLLPAVNDISSMSLKEAIKNLPRPPKPKSRAAIVQWYRTVERPNGTGLDPATNRPFIWFHGIISRSQAEELLVDKTPGSYLVRVSERIWGYTVSYMGVDGTTKHFLIEKIPDGYQFLGTNQIVHESLAHLVRHHNTTAITMKGRELLLYPVGQRIPEAPDYADLL